LKLHKKKLRNGNEKSCRQQKKGYDEENLDAVAIKCEKGVRKNGFYAEKRKLVLICTPCTPEVLEGDADKR
jgi:hypothetical protein